MVKMANIDDFDIKDHTLVKYKGKDKLVIVPKEVTKLGKRAFESNKYVEEIRFESEITSIADRAFFNCRNLFKIKNLHSKIREIGEQILDNTVYYNNSRNWEHKCLYLWENLIIYKGKTIKQVKIRKDTKTIAKFAFLGCGNLKEIVLPNGLENINQNAFASCEQLTFIHYEGTKEEFNAINKGINWILCCEKFKRVNTRDGIIDSAELINI